MDKLPGYAVDFEFPCSIFLANMVGNIVIVPLSKRMALNTRIIGNLLGMAVALIALPAAAALLSDSVLGFWVVMVILFLLGFCDHIFQASVCGIGAKMPGYYNGLFLAGTGMAGIIMNILRIITLLSFPDSEDADTIGVYIYFGVASFIMLICVFLHLKFIKSEIFYYYTMNARRKTIEYSEVTTNNNGEAPLVPKANKEHDMDFKTMGLVLKKTWLFVGLLILIYIQTFMFFPGVMLDKPIPGLDFDWKLVAVVGCYNVADTVGKLLTKTRSWFNKWSITVIVLCRFWFYFTFLLEATTLNVPIIDSTWFGFVNIALFGLTNGFTTSALFIMGPEQIVGDVEKEIAGFMSVLGLTTGIMLGTYCALPFSAITPPS